MISTQYYFYDRYVTEDHGNVHRVVTEIENPASGQKKYSATRFEYALNGRTVTFALGEEWDWGGLGCPTDYDITFAREFRYDGARQRYLNRQLDTVELLATGDLVSLSDTWSDYDGDNIYGDFSVSGSTATDLRSFEPGMATVDAWASTGDTNTTYYHTGILGSTRGTSVSGGTGIFNASWKAFGEKVVGTVGRYGFAGAWGYQAHEDLGALHVGARYYDPAIGRFLQRDSIGILGGKNVYAYVANAPTVLVDPDGLVWAWVIRGGVWVVRKAIVPVAKKAAKRAMSCAIRIALRIGRPKPTLPPPNPIYPPKPLPPLRIPPKHPRISPPNYLNN